MMLLTAAGSAMIATSVIGIRRNMPNVRLKTIVGRYLRANHLETVKIRSITRQGEAYKMELLLPYNITADKVQDHVPGIEQVTYTHVRFSYSGGPICNLEFGFSDFGDRMPFKDGKYDPLTVPLYTPFGRKLLDFNEETCCHMLCGGATRMGKSAFLRLLQTLLVTTTDGKVVIKTINNKVNDLNMFRGLPQVEIGETEEEAARMLRDAVQEMETRKALLKVYGDCVDVRELRERHPERELYPYFIIIDEYGRFADDDVIQKLVTRLVEMAGYLDMHVVIASQRPDAQTVLKPRVKANLLTRICFKTSDKKNSEVILDLPLAADLPRVQGRAVLMDGFPDIVQVPFLSTSKAREMLKPYVKEVVAHDDSTGCTDHADALPFQGFEPQAVGADHIPKPKKRYPNRKPGSKKTRT